jgi:hypothetical protein
VPRNPTELAELMRAVATFADALYPGHLGSAILVHVPWAKRPTVIQIPSRHAGALLVEPAGPAGDHRPADESEDGQAVPSISGSGRRNEGCGVLAILTLNELDKPTSRQQLYTALLERGHEFSRKTFDNHLNRLISHGDIRLIPGRGLALPWWKDRPP